MTRSWRLTGKPIRLPVWTVAEIETRANAALQDAIDFAMAHEMPCPRDPAADHRK